MIIHIMDIIHNMFMLAVITITNTMVIMATMATMATRLITNTTDMDRITVTMIITDIPPTMDIIHEVIPMVIHVVIHQKVIPQTTIMDITDTTGTTTITDITDTTSMMAITDTMSMTTITDIMATLRTTITAHTMVIILLNTITDILDSKEGAFGQLGKVSSKEEV